MAAGSINWLLTCIWQNSHKKDGWRPVFNQLSYPTSNDNAL